jgi:hypothetical protein
MASDGEGERVASAGFNAGPRVGLVEACDCAPQVRAVGTRVRCESRRRGEWSGREEEEMAGDGDADMVRRCELRGVAEIEGRGREAIASKDARQQEDSAERGQDAGGGRGGEGDKSDVHVCNARGG